MNQEKVSLFDGAVTIDATLLPQCVVKTPVLSMKAILDVDLDTIGHDAETIQSLKDRQPFLHHMLEAIWSDADTDTKRSVYLSVAATCLAFEKQIRWDAGN